MFPDVFLGTYFLRTLVYTDFINGYGTSKLELKLISLIP